MHAVIDSDGAGDRPVFSGADPYSLTNCMPISRAMVDQIHTPDARHEMIARAAYYRSQRRGFAPGHELDDWLAAERDIDAISGLTEPHANWDSPNRNA
jgi:hypothetical protein